MGKETHRHKRTIPAIVRESCLVLVNVIALTSLPANISLMSREEIQAIPGSPTLSSFTIAAFNSRIESFTDLQRTRILVSESSLRTFTYISPLVKFEPNSLKTDLLLLVVTLGSNDEHSAVYSRFLPTTSYNDPTTKKKGERKKKLSNQTVPKTT